MRRSSGFSLIELMIAITLGLILMAGVVHMFLGSRAAFSSQQAISRIQESGRLAIDFMSRDIRMAGYMGCSSRIIGRLDSTLKNSNLYPNEMLANMTSGQVTLAAIRGYSSKPTGSNLSPEPIADTDMFVVTLAKGSDVVVNKNNESATVFASLSKKETGACSDGTDRLDGLCGKDILVITDCSKARIFQATSMNDASDEIHINHAASGTPGNSPTSWGGASTDPANTYDEGSQILKMERVTYFIAKGASGLPSLWQDTNGNSVEILEGIEDMYVTYGRDTNNDGVPDVYNTAAQIDTAGVAQWTNVLSVRIQLLVQSLEDNLIPESQFYTFGEDPEQEADDRRLRHVFVNTVGIRSRLE